MNCKFIRNIWKSKSNLGYKVIKDTNFGLIHIMEFSDRIKKDEGISLL